MAGKIPQHVHCNMCWKAIPVGETFCSDECKEKFKSIKKKNRMLWYILLFMIIAFSVIMLVSPN